MAGVWGPTDAMPGMVAALHADQPRTLGRGIAQVERGRGLVARLLALVIGFPPTGLAMPLDIEIVRSDREERWTRRFAGQGFTSRLTRRDGRVVEHFGLLAFAFDLEPVPRGHRMLLRRWWCGPVPLPPGLAPRIAATETDENGRFGFDVRIALPLFGLLIAYRGSLVLVADPVSRAGRLAA
jgi:hypothetical protein